MLNTSATKEPVQAPVPGKGMATKRYNPKSFNLAMETPFLLALSYKNSKNFLVILHLPVNIAMGLNRINKKGTGSKLPSMPKTRVFHRGKL